MNFANKTFRNNKTGETVKVIDSFENIAILENKQKVDVRNLMDTNLFTEQIDPNSFFNNQEAYNAIAEKLKSIPTENLLDDFSKDISLINNEPAIIQTSEEDEMAELARKYGVSNNDAQKAVAKQQQSFSKYLDEDESSITRIEVNQNSKIEEAPSKNSFIEDPIISMFRNVKKSIDFDISLNISNKIPRLDFIEMMEDSYEVSIIDFLANEFTNNILKNPNHIKESIKNEIKRLVYEKNRNIQNSKETGQENDGIIKEKEVKKTSKLTVKERIDLINKLNSISNIEFQLKGEKSKSVIVAGNKRIEHLKNKKLV
jgi:hypothetical protein